MAKEADDQLEEARKDFERCADAESENREDGLADLRFARLGEQWPENVRKEREDEGRPTLTINKLPAFMRQVVNDARQNAPSIKVHPVDDEADPETAQVIGDLIRNIEYASDADVAYDTGIESAVNNGFGYWRVLADYAYDDSFDMDLKIGRIRNPFSVYGDPDSQAVDSSDWNIAFVTDRLGEAQFEREWGDKAKVSWSDHDAWGGASWRDGDSVIVAERWTREVVSRPILLVVAGDKRLVIDKKEFETDPEWQALVQAGAVEVKAERVTKSHKVTQQFMSGAEILDTRDWPGRFIPLIPVYGDEFDIEGKVYRRSLIHDAKDPQSMVNYWRSASTELVALAPRTPYIGLKGAFSSDAKNWATANRKSHPYLEYDPVTVGGQAAAVTPQRQQLDGGVAAGALQEALNASDDIKSVIGMYDASLGARSNETSGRAIMARQREGDVSTFHLPDNQRRAIRHTGRVLIDLIPHYYSAARIVRVRGIDGEERPVQINKAFPKTDPNGQPVMQPQVDANGQPVAGPDGQPAQEPVMQIHDLTLGKYDLTVSSGPSYTTRREEARTEIMNLIQAYPQVAPLVGDLLAKKLDWPGADEMAERLKRMVPPQALGEDGGLPPQMKDFIAKGQALIKQLQDEVAGLKADRSIDLMNAKTKQFEAQTDRIEAVGPMLASVMPPDPSSTPAPAVPPQA